MHGDVEPVGEDTAVAGFDPDLAVLEEHVAVPAVGRGAERDRSHDRLARLNVLHVEVAEVLPAVSELDMPPRPVLGRHRVAEACVLAADDDGSPFGTHTHRPAQHRVGVGEHLPALWPPAGDHDPSLRMRGRGHVGRVGRRVRRGIRVRARRRAQHDAPPRPADALEAAVGLAALATRLHALATDVAVVATRVPLLGRVAGDCRRSGVARGRRVVEAGGGEGDEGEQDETAEAGHGGISLEHGR